METTLGIHCAENLVRYGVSDEFAVRALMLELELTRDEAAAALRLATEHLADRRGFVGTFASTP